MVKEVDTLVASMPIDEVVDSSVPPSTAIALIQ